VLVRQEGRGWDLTTVPAPDSHSPTASGALVQVHVEGQGNGNVCVRPR